MTTKFEVGKIYVYERKDLFGKETLKDYYRCEKRTEKTFLDFSFDLDYIE